MKNLKLQDDENGFFSVEVLILISVMMSIVMVFTCVALLRNQQMNNGYRMTAIYLAWGYLNLMEKQQEDIIPSQIEYDGMNYSVNKDEQNLADNIYEISVKIKWQYHDKEQIEYQRREIIK